MSFEQRCRQVMDTNGEVLSESHVDVLFDVVRAALLAACGCDFEVRSDIGLWPYNFLMVNVTLRHKGVLKASTSGKGATLREALNKAAQSALNDTRFDLPLSYSIINTLTIEIWIQTERRLLSEAEKASLDSTFRPGLEGVEIELDGHFAYYKPSVPITSAIKSASTLLAKLSKKAGLSEGMWNQSAALYLTKWDHFLHDPRLSKGWTRLERLRPLERDADLSRESLRSTLELVAMRLVKTQDLIGRYAYIYSPFDDRIDNQEYNLVRHAGCTYSLAWASQVLEHSALGSACDWSARHGLHHLIDNSVRLPQVDGMFVQDESRGSQEAHGKLGSCALTLLAMQFCHPSRWTDYRNALVRTIMSVQKGDGSFNSYINSESQSASLQDFFPGEALVALCHEYRRSRDECILQSIVRAFPFYRAHFRSNPRTAFVLWQSDAWRLVHTHLHGSTSSEYSSFVFEQIDWLLQFQHTHNNCTTAAYLGGFSFPNRPKYSSGTYTEAVIRGYELATLLGDVERADHYRTAANLGLKFLQRLQVPRELSVLFPRPDFAVGAVTESLESFSMRCDYDQHFITASLAAMETPGLL